MTSTQENLSICLLQLFSLKITLYLDIIALATPSNLERTFSLHDRVDDTPYCVYASITGASSY